MKHTVKITFIVDIDTDHPEYEGSDHPDGILQQIRDEFSGISDMVGPGVMTMLSVHADHVE